MVNAYARPRGTQSHGARPACTWTRPMPIRWAAPATSAQPTGLSTWAARRAGAARPQARRAPGGRRPPRQNALRPHPLRRPHRFGRPHLCAGPHASLPAIAADAGAPSTRTSTRGPKAPAQARSKLPFVIAAAVILVVLVVRAGAGRSATSARAPSRTFRSVPITGLTDTSNPDDGAWRRDARRHDSRPPPQSAPDKRRCSTFSVAAGTEAYIEVYERSTAGRASPRTWRGRREKELRRHRPRCTVRHDQPGRT